MKQSTIKDIKVIFTIIMVLAVITTVSIILKNIESSSNTIEDSKTNYEHGMENYNENYFGTAKEYFQKVDTSDFYYYDAQKKIAECDKKIAEQEKIQKEKQRKEELAHKKWLKTKAGRYYTFCQNKGAYVSKEDCELASKNKIWIGMNYWLLVAMRGNPDHINTSNYGYGNEYQYCWNDYTISCFYDNNGDDLIDAYN